MEKVEQLLVMVEKSGWNMNVWTSGRIVVKHYLASTRPIFDPTLHFHVGWTPRVVDIMSKTMSAICKLYDSVVMEF